MKPIRVWFVAIVFAGVAAIDVSAARQQPDLTQNSAIDSPMTVPLILAAEGQISKQEARRIALAKQARLKKQINDRKLRHATRQARIVGRYNASRAQMQATHKQTRDGMWKNHEAAKRIPASDPMDNATFDQQFTKQMDKVIKQQEDQVAGLDQAMRGELDALQPDKARMDQQNARDQAKVTSLDQDIQQLGP